MKIKDILSDFLYDKDYFISLFENKIHIFKYLLLIKLSPNEIILKLSDFNLKIKGENLSVLQMNKDEILLEGNYISLEKIYE